MNWQTWLFVVIASFIVLSLLGNLIYALIKPAKKKTSFEKRMDKKKEEKEKNDPSTQYTIEND